MKRGVAAEAEKAPWREVDQRTHWEHADAIRQGLLRDTPGLDVRLDFRGGRYHIEVRP